MSRGPGYLMRRIERLFADHPEGAWTLEDLCEQVLDVKNRVAKRHRVSVRRAALAVIAKSDDWNVWQSERQGKRLVFVNLANLESYAIAMMKTDAVLHYYRP